MKRHAWQSNLIGAAVGSICILASAASADDASNAELQRQVSELKAQVAALQASSGDNWLTDQRADEVRSLVQDVLADADTRSSLLQSGVTAGWDGKPFIASPDGNFKLAIGATLQVRYVYNMQDDGPDDDNRAGFENRRTRVRFGGHVYDPSWKYYIQGDFGTSGTFEMLDAYIEKDLGDGWSFRVGKFILPFSRELLTSHTKPLLVERSITGNYFATGRAHGAMVGYKSDMFRAWGAFSNGLGSNSGTTAPALSYDTEYAFTGRVEVLIAGDWNQFGDWTSWQGEEYAVMIGGGAHYECDEYGTAALETKTFRWTVDVGVEGGGWNVGGAVYGNHTDTDGATDVDQYGFFLQGGFFFTEDLEVVARYEWADDDSSADELSIITAGCNYYIRKHNLKWSTDIGFGLNEVTSTFSSAGGGWRTDSAGQDGQIVFRSQLQLYF